MSQPTSGGKKEAFVGEYAWLIHEHMGWGNVRMSIMPSERSVAAGLANGVHAGGRFMDRAPHVPRQRDSEGYSRTSS